MIALTFAESVTSAENKYQASRSLSYQAFNLALSKPVNSHQMETIKVYDDFRETLGGRNVS